MVMLMTNVSSNYFLVHSDGRREVPTCPQTLSLVKTMGTFDLFLHPGRTFAFDDLHGIRDRVSGCEKNDQVDMIFLDVQLYDLPVFPLCDGLKYPSEFLFNLWWTEYLSPVFWCPYDVVFEIVEAMG